MTEETKKKKKLEEDIAALKTELANVEREELKKRGTAQEIPGDEGKEPEEVTDPIEEKEKQKTAGDKVVMPNGSTASKKTVTVEASKYAELEKAVARLEADKRASLIDSIIDLHATAGMVSDETEKEEREELKKKKTEKLEEEAAIAEKYVGRILEIAQQKGVDIGSNQSTPSRIVRMPSSQETATASKQSQSGLPRKLSDLNGGWFE